MTYADDVDALARTIYGEARSEPWLGQIAVGWVVRNRVMQQTWFGKTFEAVCRKPFQFSCWNDGDPNRDLITAANLMQMGFIRSFGAACAVFMGDVPDPTDGADHYHTVAKPAGAREWPPRWTWVMRKTVVLGAHVFYAARKPAA